MGDSCAEGQLSHLASEGLAQHARESVVLNAANYAGERAENCTVGLGLNDERDTFDVFFGKTFVETRADFVVVERGDEMGLNAFRQQLLEDRLRGDDDDSIADAGRLKKIDIPAQARARRDHNCRTMFLAIFEIGDAWSVQVHARVAH